MHKNIRQHNKLLVISDTAMYQGKEGIYAFEPVVKEIESIAPFFDEIIWLGCRITDTNRALKIPDSSRIKLVQMPKISYKSTANKWHVLFAYPVFLYYIAKHYFSATHVHTRGPSHPALIGILFSIFNSSKRIWHKYAGNWNQENPPLFYSIQKKILLKVQKNYITINGKWPGQPDKCLTFENPCLDDADRKNGLVSINKKIYNAPFVFCFVGRLEKEKGIFNLINALTNHPDVSKISMLELVGEGVSRQEIEDISQNLPFPVKIHGFLQRSLLFEVYNRAHFIVLPSESEGFPKVIAEAANFGCIPIVSDVSCIGQYINSTNGFLWNKKNGSFEDFFEKIDFSNLETKAMQAHKFAEDFTYEKYVEHLQETVFYFGEE